jgi:hypothetical protein
LNNIEKQVARHSYVPERRIPTFKKLAEDWIKVKANKVRASTLEGYKGHLRHHFDDIKDVPVNRITPVIVEHYLADLEFNGAPGRIRTCDLRIRSPALYPAELRARIKRFESGMLHKL